MAPGPARAHRSQEQGPRVLPSNRHYDDKNNHKTRYIPPSPLFQALHTTLLAELVALCDQPDRFDFRMGWLGDPGPELFWRNATGQGPLCTRSLADQIL